MNIKRTTLLRKIPIERGELYCAIKGNRRLLAKCGAEIEVYEEERTVPIMGRDRAFKKIRYSLVLCDELEFTRSVEEEHLKLVEAFDLKGQVQRPDGIFDTVNLNNLIPTERWSADMWEFSFEGEPDVLKVFGI